MLQCVVVCCSALQCAAVCCNVSVAVCCNVLQCCSVCCSRAWDCVESFVRAPVYFPRSTKNQIISLESINNKKNIYTYMCILAWTSMWIVFSVIVYTVTWCVRMPCVALSSSMCACVCVCVCARARVCAWLGGWVSVVSVFVRVHALSTKCA